MTNSVSISLVERVEADVNYLLYNGQRPVTYTYPPPPGIPQRSGIPDPRRVQIANARLLPQAPSLDTFGFELHEQATEVDFASEVAIREIYYRETEVLLRRATGAEKVVIFDHTLRDSTPAHGQEGIREPVLVVHNDQTFTSAPRRVLRHLPADEAAARLQHRFAIINAWRPIGHAVQNWPLAVLDGRTLEVEDLIASDLVYRDMVGEIYAVLHRERHRWFYFPNLRTDEVALIKIYDSNTDGTVRLSAHTAFADPTSPPDAPPRRSIELRALVFFPPAS